MKSVMLILLVALIAVGVQFVNMEVKLHHQLERVDEQLEIVGSQLSAASARQVSGDGRISQPAVIGRGTTTLGSSPA